ncbi:hypothetical protein Scep_009779 [Stephania cephalantha]|uniref:Uncharacterized protein n=1 Tax=Stephania cephalantha TaxID=152367 RepID=A0AAP0JTS9_9MAGN
MKGILGFRVRRGFGSCEVLLRTNKDMAQSKATVTRKEAGSESLRANHSHHGWTSYCIY